MTTKYAKLTDYLKALKAHGKTQSSKSAIEMSRAKAKHLADKAMFKREMAWAGKDVK